MPCPTPPHNFSAGPGALPDPVLLATQQALREIPETGLPILGISHRSPWFRNVLDEAEQLLRSLLGLHPSFHVLFLQGGSTLQFSQIPISFLRGHTSPADYLHTGYWSGKSIPEARREGPVRVAWSGEPHAFRSLPNPSELSPSPNAPYFHYVSNETVEGVQFHHTPGRDDIPRFCDMSSDLLSAPVDTSRFSLIYAHAQKNLGPSGVTLVLIRDELLQTTPPNLPSMLDYRRHAEARSIYNTPPVFAIYVTLLVLRWLHHDIGGLAAMNAINQTKARTLYHTLDSSSGFYLPRAHPDHRSVMNVVFDLHDPNLSPTLLLQAQHAGFHGLEGHRSLPSSIRASLYNAVPQSSVDALCDFLRDFARRHG